MAKPKSSPNKSVKDRSAPLALRDLLTMFQRNKSDHVRSNTVPEKPCMVQRTSSCPEVAKKGVKFATNPSSNRVWVLTKKISKRNLKQQQQQHLQDEESSSHASSLWWTPSELDQMEENTRKAAEKVETDYQHSLKWAYQSCKGSKASRRASVEAAVDLPLDKFAEHYEEARGLESDIAWRTVNSYRHRHVQSVLDAQQELRERQQREAAVEKLRSKGSAYDSDDDDLEGGTASESEFFSDLSMAIKKKEKSNSKLDLIDEDSEMLSDIDMAVTRRTSRNDQSFRKSMDDVDLELIRQKSIESSRPLQLVAVKMASYDALCSYDEGRSAVMMM